MSENVSELTAKKILEKIEESIDEIEINLFIEPVSPKRSAPKNRRIRTQELMRR